MEDQPHAPESHRGGMPSPRLLLGGLLLGLSSVTRAFSRAEAAQTERPGASAAGAELTPGTMADRPAEARTSEPAVVGTALPAALAGLLLESHRQAARGADAVERSAREVGDLIVGSGLPGTHRTRQALVRGAERMEARGRAELDRLASVSRAEEQRLAGASQAAFREAADEIIDDVLALAIERLAESAKIRRMIEQESSTLLDDFLDGVREWCAHGDDRVERAARRVFRGGRPRPAESPDTAKVAAATVECTSLGAVLAYTKPAGFVSRAAALLVDAVLITGAAAAGGYLISTALEAFRPGVLGHYLPIIPVTLFAGLFLVYFVFSWAALGRTIGMGVVGLKMLTLEGRRVSLARAILRYVGYLLSTAFILLGFLWVLVDDRRLGWLDHVARTKVVRAPLPDEDGG